MKKRAPIPDTSNSFYFFSLLDVLREKCSYRYEYPKPLSEKLFDRIYNKFEDVLDIQLEINLKRQIEL